MCASSASDRVGQEVPTLFEESACVQHGQLAGSSSDMCEHSASDRGGQEVPTLFEGSVKQSTRMSSGCGGQEVPTLFEESAFVQHSQPASVHPQIQTRGVRKSRPLFEESARQSVCMSSDRRRQEVPTLLEESTCVQHSQLAGVPLQPQTVRVMKS